MVTESILRVKELVTAFDTEEGRVRAVEGVSFEAMGNQTLGIVGESGCGKSVTALSLMRLLPKPSGTIESGEILFHDTDIAKLTPDEMHRIRGSRIAMIFQEPMTALNPVHKIGKQIAEVFRLHRPELSKADVIRKSADMLRKVGIPDPDKRMDEYPHQISGGMRQRVMIAMALAGKPDILIADEPTTALDVTIQAQILDLMKDLQRETGMTIIFITHDLGVIAEICDHVVVMYAGKVAEAAPVKELFQNPRHPYTLGLLSSIPRLEYPRKTRLNVIKGMVPSLLELPQGCRFRNRCPVAQDICKTEPPMESVGPDHSAACFFRGQGSGVSGPSSVVGLPQPATSNQQPATSNQPQATGNRQPATSNQRPATSNQQPATSNPLSVRNLKMHFPVLGGVFRRQVGTVHAVDGVSFEIGDGETLGLVGESGCGKTTVGRSIMRIYDPTGGDVLFEGKNMARLRGRELRELRRQMQMIFQDPFESLNSRHTIRDILEEPFVIHGIGTPEERKAKVEHLLDRVGLPENAMDRFPHEFSGGQRQRIGIARAIALEPSLIICDEPVSALDVSIQSQILNLLLELQEEMNLSCLFIAHDLAVVKHISDQIAVMYLGKIVEHTDADRLYENPLHPYTRTLLSAIPVPDPCAKAEKQILSGDVPSPVNPPPGCRFHTRCPVAADICRIEEPILRPVPEADEREHMVACHLV